mmetsp:Transcript_80169/g.183726  ORF Transcript_80169/g.183726 Transcript_80169/m.183726 type:complete len:264 (-) Transcript_80169:76-867(-)
MLPTARLELCLLVTKLRKEGADEATIQDVKRRFREKNNFQTAKEKKIEKAAKFKRKVSQTRRHREWDRQQSFWAKQAEEAHAAKMEEAKAKGSHHEVVIIPIFQKTDGVTQFKATELAHAVRQRLTDKAINAWVDRRIHLLPGQKFKFWEEAGVKHRVEIGPRDVKAEPPTCTVSFGEVAGAVAQRKMAVSLSGPSLLVALSDFGLQKATINDSDEFYSVESMLEEKPKVDTSGDALEGNVAIPEPSEQKEQTKKVKKKGHKK